MKLKSLVVMAMMLMSSVVVRAQMDFPDADSKYATELLKPGTKAPDFHLKTAEGKNFRLSSLKGKIVVLDFCTASLRIKVWLSWAYLSTLIKPIGRKRLRNMAWNIPQSAS